MKTGADFCNETKSYLRWFFEMSKKSKSIPKRVLLGFDIHRVNGINTNSLPESHETPFFKK